MSANDDLAVNLFLAPVNGGDYVRAGEFPSLARAMAAGARECAGKRFEGFAVRNLDGGLINETSYAVKSRFLPARSRFNLAQQVEMLGADSLLPGFGKTPNPR